MTTHKLSWLAVEQALHMGAGKWFASPETDVVCHGAALVWS